MYKVFSIIIANVALNLTINAQNIELTYSDSTLLCYYSMHNGMLNGKYSSFYKNGTKKAEGQFYHNNRIGIWKVWDNNGNIRAVRKYENNFFYKRIQPRIPKDKSIELVNYIPQKPTKNTNSYFEFCRIREKDAFYSMKYQSLLIVNKTTETFQLDTFINFLISKRDTEDFATYKIFENYNRHTFDIESSQNKTIIAFKITKEIIYDLDRQLLDSRIVFLAPVIVDTVSGQINDYNWFYYYDIHPYLAEFKLDLNENKITVQNISDVFFWNYYPEIIIRKQDSFYNKKEDIPTSAFKNEKEMEKLALNSEKFMIEEIENEHNIWIYFTKNPNKQKCNNKTPIKIVKDKNTSN